MFNLNIDSQNLESLTTRARNNEQELATSYQITVHAHLVALVLLFLKRNATHTYLAFPYFLAS